MRLTMLLPILFMGCHIGRPPQNKLPNGLQTTAWAVQPGLEALIQKEVLASVSSIGTTGNETIELTVVSIQEQPQLYFPNQGTLWLVRIEMRAAGHDLPEPLNFIGQAHYTFEGPKQFSMSREHAYAQAVEQISEQLTRSIVYRSPSQVSPSR
ncbi:MAG: hypothetical protein ACON4U_10015 [Myxococcota bacterium]